jgi:ubiquinone biosynthesis protein
VASIRKLARLLTIAAVLVRFRLDRLHPASAPTSTPVRILLRLIRLFPAPADSPEVSLRLALESLGPIFIKFGQLLSTRQDILSPALARELTRLQDQVPPFSSGQARAVIEANLGKPIEDVFLRFGAEPLASASVAQVHTAVLATTADHPEQGEQEVVIKIIRPGIEATIRVDLAIMYVIASLVERYFRDGRRLHVVEVVQDYERTILNELNLQLEAANTATLRENWIGSHKLYVPEVYWDYCTTDMMVMERIYGVRATDIDVLDAHRVNLRKLAHLGVEIFFTQVFEHNFFHADMHPGNVFIDTTDPEDPTYIALDSAIIGSLTEQDQRYLAENLLAFFHQDYARVASLHVESGWVPADTDVRAFEAVIRSVCAPIFQKPIKDISFGKVLVSLFNTARQFNMEVQPQLVLLQKTLLNIEGMGRQIYPDLDLWETAAPYMERWMAGRVGVLSVLRRLRERGPHWMARLPELPDLAMNALTEIDTLGDQARRQSDLLAEIKSRLDQQARQTRFARLGGIALIAALGAALLPLSGYASPPQALVGSSILGSLGIYWLYLQA